ncbi:sulfotransferase [Clostridium minihomine]|uniref:sulfotransferase n=1 Tax=Clostridium minihomine TaxID=2045012 RepID=UPI0013EB4BC3|nr:sulfotransferase [Clostridium minihomine]
MTQEEIKKMDRRIQMVRDPFGTGFPSFCRLLEETSQKKGESREEILRQLMVWKIKSRL